MQKTPAKLEKKSLDKREKSPEKAVTSAAEENKKNSTPLKETEKPEHFEFNTPEKNSKSPISVHESPENQLNKYKTPPKKEEYHGKSEPIVSFDGEDEMISTTEQARLLIAASKTPSKSVNKTPAKQKTPSAKRSIDSSPGTPGKYRRVELITLASPKAKLIKEL